MHYYLLLAIALLLGTATQAQSADSAAGAELITKPILAKMETQARFNRDSVHGTLKQIAANVTRAPNNIGYIIIFLPVFLFAVTVLSVTRRLRKEKVKLSHFLLDKDILLQGQKEEKKLELAKLKSTENTFNLLKSTNTPLTKEQVDMVIAGVPQNADETPADHPPAKPDQEQSVSRLIAYITAVTSMALAACILSFYFHQLLSGKEVANLSPITNVLFGLGLGVLPYGFNKVASVFKPNSP
jgi:hypothetical protein